MTALKRKVRHAKSSFAGCARTCGGDTDGLKIDDTSGTGTVTEWMEDVYDIEWITHNDHSYKGARLLVAGGGPSIWVNLQGLTVDGYWWGDHCKVPFADNLGLDEYLEELHASSK